MHFFLAENPDVRHLEFSTIKAIGPTAMIITELTQEELTRRRETTSILEWLVEHMLAGGRVINDPRSVLIAHDKRLLTLLSDKDFLLHYLNVEEASLISEHVVATFCSDKQLIVKDKERWLLKAAASGKEKGMQIGSQTPNRIWQELLSKPDYVAQLYLEQEIFHLWDKKTKAYQPANLAGTLPFYNQSCFGPGLDRFYEISPHKYRGLLSVISGGN
jgi:hypothetical protein